MHHLTEKIYRLFCAKKNEVKRYALKKVYEFWVNELQNSFSLQVKDGHSNLKYTDEEMRYFVRPRRSTILHGVIYTKEQLFKYGFVGNNLCSFCQQEIETYEHVFLNCKKVKDYMENFDYIL